ncbi:YaaC family protein [Hymenobacter psychrophilus]|uniref:YaaC-like Protein n=1 Tax=Hymenobacter psychrophilus TaxID=651662 RepID=A0A1H3GPQ6_9BACT|nr:YaaC family protein [Hymenobacter psychrophilus]SDY05087.1 YaaC-like Protein [Hymenobacter psychrophilus]
MNNIWHFLRDFESKELIKRYVKNRFEYSINTSKAHEIASAFAQAREYFVSYEKADISVKPLLQYYGVIALSRGLVLILNKDSRENNIVPSHGLKIKNWNEVSHSGKLEDIVLKTSKGTFIELIHATNNLSYFRVGSSGIGWKIKYGIPENEIEVLLKDIIYCFPDLSQSIDTWLDISIPSIQFEKSKSEEGIVEMEFRYWGSSDVIHTIFPVEKFDDLDIKVNEVDSKAVVRFKNNRFITISQKWVSAFRNIGDPYVSPLFKNDVFINDISKMYSISFVLGTISRYYPATWGNINKGIANDSILPFAINMMDFIQDKYPRIVMDFIKAPYEFEKK